tara:strand:+ start:6561 stop:6704 length:144 start_codon:yes stop_codon:yes gene_type:complete
MKKILKSISKLIKEKFNNNKKESPKIIKRKKIINKYGYPIYQDRESK